jgi:Ion channel
VLVQLQRTLRSHFLPRRHTALLVAIVTAFAVRPLIGDAGVGPIVFSIAILLLLLVALYTTQVDELVGERDMLLVEKRRRSVVGWVLAVPAIAERLGMMFAPSPSLYLVGSICWFLFFSFITWSELRSVLKQREVTSETISLAISVYLLFGLTWGVLYIVLFQCQPDAFSFAASPSPTSALADNPQHIFPVFIYFSLTTLSTIGFGDITPITLQARYAAVAEGITGQFYLAILVARLVGMQMSQSANQDTRTQPRTLETARSVDRDR